MVRQLAENHRVLWIEVTGMRNPRFSVYDFRRAAGKIVRIVKGAQRVESMCLPIPKNLKIASPITIPLPSMALMRSFNDRKITQVLINETRRLEFSKFGLITTLPMAAKTFATAKVSGLIDAAWKMYYCPDEWALWPGMEASLVRRWESELLANVDCIVVSSEQLKKTKSISGKPVYLVPHGVDVSHFSRAHSSTQSKRIKFFGMFDERIDEKLLVALATQFSDYIVEVIGPVQAPLSGDLPANIVFSGLVSYDLLPERLRDAALLILPYLRNELTDNINPLKGRECLATGKPVLATALPELVKMGGVFTAQSKAEFIDCAKRILSGSLSYDGSAAIESMRRHSWQSRAAELLSLVQALKTTTAH